MQDRKNDRLRELSAEIAVEGNPAPFTLLIREVNQLDNCLLPGTPSRAHA